jgi:hypothetical protein
MVIADGEVKLGEWVAVEHMQQLCFKMEGKKDIFWTKQPEFKYISTSSNVPAQNEAAPIILGVCQHCGQRKEQHNAKGALSTFTFSGDASSSQPVTMETTMTAADFSGKELGVSGGMMVAAFLPKCQ